MNGRMSKMDRLERFDAAVARGQTEGELIGEARGPEW